MGELVERGLRGHLCNGIDGNLSSLGVSLTIAVHHFEGDFFDVQGLQCPCSVPYWNGGHLIFGTIGLRQHEPVTTEHEALECDFVFNVGAVWPLLCDGALAGDRHTQLNGLLSALHMSA